MTSRNHHSADSRPGPSWREKLLGTNPIEAEKRMASSRSHGSHAQHGRPGGPSTSAQSWRCMFDKSHMAPQPNVQGFVKRVNGKCDEKYKQFDYPQKPTDPRIKFRRVDQPKDLTVPNLMVDDQYTGIPPKREVTISNLNDNVNKEFLLKMTRNQKFQPQEVNVFYHPVSKKHLKMALILFSKSKEAKAFVEANNNVSVMGSPISCRLDPFAAELSAAYSNLVNVPLPALEYLSGMSEHELSLRREKIIRSNAGPTPPVETAPPFAAPIDPERNRSLSPMDTSNSPVHYEPPVKYEPLIPPPPVVPPQPQHPAYHDDAGASTSKMPSPPPPYSELPPINHATVPEERRSSSRKHSVEPEGRPRNNKRRHASTSSSSSYSSGEGKSNGSRRRSDGGVKKRKREEYLKVKRYVSSERDSNGDKRILKEVKTVTYKSRTEERTTIRGGGGKKSPDSFDEEMKRRERSSRRSSESRRDDRVVRHRAEQRRRRDEMGGWSSPSSDSDSGRRRKRGKDRSESHTREEERRPPPQPDVHPSSTPLSFCSVSSTSVTPSSRRSGFQSAPLFDPSLPPPVMVPPVGIVLPGCSSLPPLPPPALIPMPPMPPMPMPMPHMMVPPPPLPGGFIPPPEFFGLQSTPAMLCAVSAAAAGMTPLPPGPPPPSPMSSIGYGATPAYGSTPLSNYASPVRPVKMPHRLPHLEDHTAGGCSMSASVSSPSLSSSGMARVSSTSSLTTGGGRTPMEIRAMATPPSEGSSTPSTHAALTASAEKKVPLDDRLSMMFGLKKTKKEEEAREMKHSASAPSTSTMEAQQRKLEDDDMDIDDDDDMDVASSSPEETRRTTVVMERREVTEEETRREADSERKKKEDQASYLTKLTLNKLVQDLTQQITKDLQKQLEKTAFKVADEWEQRQRSETEDKRKQMLQIRDNLAANAAASMAIDPTQAMLIAKLQSPEGLNNGISKMFRETRIIKKKIAIPVYSRDGTPASREDSRAQSRTKSRSASRSRSRSRSPTAASDYSSSSESEEEDEMEDGVNKSIKKRPNVRNIDSSQESSMASSDSSETESEEEDELDVVGIDEDEVEALKKEIKEEQEGSSSPSVLPSPSPAAAAASPDVAAPPYQLPLVPGRTLLPTALHQRIAASNMARGGGGKVPGYPSPCSSPSPLAAAAAVAPSVQQPLLKPIKTKKDVQKRIEGTDRIPHELLSLLPPDVPRKAIKVEEKKRQKRTFKRRTDEEERKLRDSFMAGVDKEDDTLMKELLEEMQKNGARPFGVDRLVEFDSFLRAYCPRELSRPQKSGRVDLYYDDESLAGIVPHSTGCARSEGFYRLTNKQKIRILRRPEAFQDRTEVNERDEVVTRHQLHAQKEQRSMNRRLLTMADTNPNSDFFKVNQLKYRKKMIKFARSRIHGWGLYALEPIAPDDMIVEYIGQKIRPIVAEEREKQYERRGIGSSYLFRIDEDEVIDATRQGNFARFINHSCQPNCYAKVVTVDGDKRIVIYSKNLIQKGDEITYDYKFPVEEDKIDCLCGAPACRGFLN